MASIAAPCRYGGHLNGVGQDMSSTSELSQNDKNHWSSVDMAKRMIIVIMVKTPDSTFYIIAGEDVSE